MQVLWQLRLASLFTDIRSFLGPGLDQVVVSGTNFALTIILAHQLGAEKFGVWAALWIGVYLAGAFHDALIVTPLQVFTYEKARRGEQNYLGAMMTIQLGFLLVVSAFALLVFFVANLISLFSVDLSTIAATLCLINSYLASECYRKIFFIQQRSAQALVLDCIRFGILLAAVLVYFALGAPGDDLKIIVWIAALANVCGVLFGWAVLRCASCGDRAYVEQVARESWNYSRWLVALEISQRAGLDLVYAIAGWVLGIAALGALRAFSQILGILNLYLAVLNNILPPAMSRRLADEGPARLAGDLVRLLALSAILGGVLIVLTSVDPKSLVTILLGQDFAPYAPSLPVMAVGYVAFLLSYPVKGTLLAFRDSRGMAIANFAGAGVSVVLAYPLTIWMGAVGAALAFSLYFMVEAIGFALAARRCFAQTRRVNGALTV